MSPDISISGIPASVMDCLRTIVLRLFEAFGIVQLAVGVLDVRCLTKKDSAVIGNRQRPSAADASSW